jgi:hypothetical protein
MSPTSSRIGLRLRRAARLALHLERRRRGADEARQRVLGAPLRRELALRLVEIALQARKLGDERLQRGLRVVEEHHAEGADHFALFVAQGNAAHHEGARLVGEQVDEDRLAGLDHVAHERVRHHLLDRTADEFVGALEAERRQELAVAVVDPDYAPGAVHQHHALADRRE